MSLSQGLYQKQLQKLSPQQIQLMKLLQIPTANLEERIKEEIEENPALEEDEEGHEDEYSEVNDEFKDKVSIIVGVGGFDTKSVIDEIKSYNGLYHALMISAPYYNKPTQEGLFQHFSHIIDLTLISDPH